MRLICVRRTRRYYSESGGLRRLQRVAICTASRHTSDILQQSLQERLISLVHQHGSLRPREAEQQGIPREYLLRLMRKGVLERTGRGLYRIADAPVTEFHSLAEVAKRVPHATFCLLSALVFHDMTTQNPSEVWAALPSGARTPRLDHPKLRVFRFSRRTFTEGRQEHRIEGVPVRIYSPSKTIADCFRFRSRVGLDVALEALREGVRKRKATIAEIRHFAEICRVARVIQPYLESLP